MKSFNAFSSILVLGVIILSTDVSAVPVGLDDDLGGKIPSPRLSKISDDFLPGKRFFKVENFFQVAPGIPSSTTANKGGNLGQVLNSALESATADILPHESLEKSLPPPFVTGVTDSVEEHDRRYSRLAKNVE